MTRSSAALRSRLLQDALNALPTTIVKDVPVSLRTTGLVLVTMIAAPPVEPHFLFEQRGLACVLLAIASWVGLRHGGSNARIADALYSLLGGWAAVVIFAATGPAKGERGHDANGRRENVTALAAGFLGYAGLRVTRAGLSPRAADRGAPISARAAEPGLVELSREEEERLERTQALVAVVGAGAFFGVPDVALREAPRLRVEPPKRGAVPREANARERREAGRAGDERRAVPFAVDDDDRVDAVEPTTFRGESGAGGLSGFRFRVVADAVAVAVAAVAFAAVAAFVVVVNARRSDLGDHLRDGRGAVLGK